MSARKIQITEKTLRALKPGEEIADTIVPGFRIRPHKSGHSFILFRRFNGVPTRRAIGQIGKISLAEARAKARE